MPTATISDAKNDKKLKIRPDFSREARFFPIFALRSPQRPKRRRP